MLGRVTSPVVPPPRPAAGEAGVHHRDDAKGSPGEADVHQRDDAKGSPGEAGLHHHGDAEVAPGLVDLAVNVRRQPMPEWLAEPIRAALTELAAYPRDGEASAAVAARHGRDPTEVLLTAGAAQAFVLIAQSLRDACRPVVVHPQFTEPEAALRNAGHPVERVLLREEDGFRLDPALVPADADLVFVG